ncbi:serine/threonine-protein kinase [Actinomadura litoris]|uniref:serine/threonine-protein kinase n=1 Tax=Actinomadura litoris TaxID=2678616 RepID=UPI001FEB4A5D|nr:serine/threonine-protein kinase [Actinomadura litoris]
MPNEPGERLLARRYRLVTQVGRGGMGTVWQAHDEVLGRDVAVKEVILPHGLTDEERAVHHKRTFREARTAARLGHPGVVTVYDVVEEDDRPWIIMELIRARSLDQVIKQEGPLEPRRAAEIGRQMLAALHAAHEAGVLHRDVKPSNVLVTGSGGAGDRAVLTDFGIATAAGDATLTQTGLVMGSPAYIAPERARGRVAGPASDLWSLGVTLYAMLHGKSPFERPEPMAALVAVISEAPDPPEKGGRLVPVIEGLLHKNPDQRMGAIEAGALLDDIVRQETVDTQRTMAVEYPVEAPAAQTRVTPIPELPDVPDTPEIQEVSAPDNARPDQLTRFDPVKKPAKPHRPRPATSPQGAPPTRARGPAGPGDTAHDEPRPDTTVLDDSTLAAAAGAVAPAGSDTSWQAGPPTRPAGAVHQPPPPPGAPEVPGRPAIPALALNRNALIIGVVVLVIIVVIAGIAMASSGGGSDDPDEKGARPAPKSQSPSPSAPATSAKPSGTPKPTLPAGFRMHHDRSGYAVPVPDGWKGPERKTGGDFFYSPDRAAYIQIDQTDKPGASAIDDWRRADSGGPGFPGYKKIKIAPSGDQPPVRDTGSGDRSADWEFTFDGDGGRLHILNRGFVANGHGYAILVRAPDGGWGERFAALQPVFRFFEAAKK